MEFAVVIICDGAQQQPCDACRSHSEGFDLSRAGRGQPGRHREPARALAGYDVEVTGDASDALRRLAQGRYDLVISDLRIGLDGPGLYRQVVRRWPNEHPRFLLVSSSLDVSNYAQLLSLAHIPVLLKPFNADHLREMVRRVLEAT